MPRDHDLSPNEIQAERLLLKLRPELDEAARERIEVAVLGRPSRSRTKARARRRRRFALGGALAAGLASLALVLSVVGGLPGFSDSESVTADDDCVMVQKREVINTPVTVEGPKGQPRRLEFRRQVVKRWVERCR